MTNTKLPWRPGGAKGGEQPEGVPGEMMLMQCVAMPWLERGSISSNGMVFMDDRFYMWGIVEWWLPMADVIATLPTEGESNGE